MLKTEKVLLKIEAPIATVTLNRPEVLNTMDGEMWQGLADAGDAINYEPEVRVVIITGAGDRAFSSGLDLKQAANREASYSGPRTPGHSHRLRGAGSPDVAPDRLRCSGGPTPVLSRRTLWPDL